MSNRTHPSDSTAFDADHDSEWTVTLPPTLRSRIDQRLPNTEFDSAEAYVVYAMESLLRELDEQDARADGDADSDTPTTDTSEFTGTDPGSDGVETDEMDDADSEAMEERLESLGYL